MKEDSSRVKKKKKSYDTPKSGSMKKIKIEYLK